MTFKKMCIWLLMVNVPQIVGDWYFKIPIGTVYALGCCMGLIFFEVLYKKEKMKLARLLGRLELAELKSGVMGIPKPSVYPPVPSNIKPPKK